jgi:UDP-N-acetylmuramoylalanine--D-glutamate ligase
MGGNIGRAVFDIHPAPEEWIILELSSYQIERSPTFQPDIAILTNITPDHLDRHGSMDHYAAIKAQIFKGKGQGIIATDDDYCRQIAAAASKAGKRAIYQVSGYGSHHEQNKSIALALSDILKIDPAKATAALKSFKALPHRQNTVRTIGDIICINDSKATNVDAAQHALKAHKDIIWIVGGESKEGGLYGLEPHLKNIKHACIIGKNMAPIAKWMEVNNVPYTLCGTIKAAVPQSYKIAQDTPAKTILLAPACASFDQYKNFAARGEDFESCVMELEE